MDRMALIADLLERARMARASGAEVLITDTESFHAVSHRGRVQRAVDSESHRITVRVWDAAGRAAWLEGELPQAKALLEQALERVSDGEADPHGGPVGRSATQGSTSGIDDRRYENIGKEDRLEVLTTAERAASQVDRSFETSGFSYRDARTRRWFGNSRNVRLKEAGTVFRVEGSVRSPSLDLALTDVVQDRAFATVASIPFGAALARRLEELDGPTTTVSGPVRMMLPPRVVAEIVALLGPHFRHASLEKGTSFLSRGRSGGDLQFSPLLHMVDDGRLPGALNSTGFDDRGVAPVPLTLIRDGQVEGWYLDVAEARSFDVRATGHRRGGRLMPGNLVVRGGSRSMNALLAEQTEPVVMLDHARGLIDGLDVKTGALRFGASGRLVVPRNETRGMIPRMVITGNLIEVLGQVVGLASDTDRIEHVDAPGILVDGLSVE